MKSRRKTNLSWKDVELVALDAFGMAPSGIPWAKRAWGILVQAQLVSYTNETEHCVAGLHFLALASLFQDFALQAWGRKISADAYGWTEALKLDPYMLGALIAERAGLDEDIDQARAEQTLRALADDVRPPLLAALCEGFGNEQGLFNALWTVFDASAGFTGDTDWHGNGSNYYLCESVLIEDLPAYRWLHDLLTLS